MATRFSFRSFFLGAYPATYASFNVCRQKLRDKNSDVWKTFWKTYKRYFNFKEQIKNYLWLLIGVFIYIDLKLVYSYGGGFSFVLGALLLTCFIVYLLCSIFIITLDLHYDLTFINQIRLAIFIPIIFPKVSLGIVMITLLSYLILIKLPVLFFLIGVAGLIYLYMKLSLLTFRVVESKGYLIIK